MKMWSISWVPARSPATPLGGGTVLLVVSILGSHVALAPASTSGVPRTLGHVWPAGRAVGPKGAQLQVDEYTKRGGLHWPGHLDHWEVDLKLMAGATHLSPGHQVI